MSSEIEVSETPNWLKELEAKRENRVKARLGHEAGAGAPCLKCGDKCPGLDLHFWRKCCKICKCSKEEHEVQDDDIYGWAQFQLLGSKPNKSKRKILLPGKNDEIDLEWVPKGHNDTIDKYLKTLPPEQLPVKGSQAAQDRKQLLQKQIPIHDIDPSLCHELTEDELKKMNEYISHVKQASAGVGQIVSLSSIIKGKLHMLNPAEAAIIASRYAKGVHMSEIVKLQGHNKTTPLDQNLEKMSLKNKNLPQFVPGNINQSEDITNPLIGIKMHDREYPLCSNDINRSMQNPQYSSSLEQKQNYLQNPNFDPKNRPSNFITSNAPYDANLHRETVGKSPIGFNSENSAFVPYQKIPIAPNNSTIKPNNNYSSVGDNEQIYENVRDLKKPLASLPNYAPGKFNTFAETQSPTKIPKNFKDLAFSTYEPDQIDPNEHSDGFKLGKYRQPGSYSDGFRPIETGNYTNSPNQQFEPINLNVSRGDLGGHDSQYGKRFEPIDPNIPRGEYDSQIESLSTKMFNSNSHPINSTSLKSGELKSGNTSSGHQFPSYLETACGTNPNTLNEEGILGHNPNKYGGSLLKSTKQLSELHPTDININEDFLNPSQVNIGRIQDINYPDIKTATHEVGDFYEEYSPDSIKEILNNVILPDCHYCKKPFEENEFAVTIDRANVLFHAGCFKCAGCNQILADNVYFYNKETDNIYCLRDYAKIRGFPRCKACDELIFTKEYCLAENSTFHLKHFCCTECDMPLAGQDYLLEDEMPYCVPCYEQNKASKCNTCCKVIKPDEVGCNLKGIHFHAVDACYACKVCKMPLMGKKLLLRNDQLYCSHECFGKDQRI